MEGLPMRGWVLQGLGWEAKGVAILLLCSAKQPRWRTSAFLKKQSSLGHQENLSRATFTAGIPVLPGYTHQKNRSFTTYWWFHSTFTPPYGHFRKVPLSIVECVLILPGGF